MIEQHPCFLPPSNQDTKIWRYMSLPKFLDLLQRQALYFCRADLLGDPFEGALTKNYANVANEIIAEKDKGLDVGGWKEIPDDMIRKIHEGSSLILSGLINTLYVSCWHQNEHESVAMWRLYSSGEPIIAIQTRFSKLANLLPSKTMLGLINYIDYDLDNIERDIIFRAIMHKRLSFTHENEIRAIFWDIESLKNGLTLERDKTPYGHYIDVDVRDLIEKIYIDPTAPKFFKEVVEKISETMRIKVEIVSSRLSERPIL